MARYVSEYKLKNVHNLITKVTHLKPGEENFQRCETFALSSIYNHNYFDPHSKDVQKEMNGMIEKLTLHAHFDRARMLQEAYDSLIKDDNLSDENREDIWRILHFLVMLSNTPAIDKPVKVQKYVVEKEDDTEIFDWVAYLREGIEIDPALEESSDESVWSLSEDEQSSEDDPPVLNDLENEEQIISILSGIEDVSLEQDAISEESLPQPEKLLEFIGESWQASEQGFQHDRPTPLPQFPAATLIDSWFKVSGVEKENMRVLSEYMIIRELLWVLRDPRACGLVFKQSDNHKFTVAEDLAVCSLTPQAIQVALSDFCPVLSTLSEMHTFIEELIPNTQVDLEPPATYKAYASCLHVIFKQQNAKLLEIEKEVMKQDDIATVHSISDQLRPWVQFQISLHRVHKSALDNWKLQDYWICATKLLSVLGKAVDEACSPEMSSVFLSLLLSSLQPYFDMTQDWLKSGELRDPHKEFIIARDIEDGVLLEGDYHMQPLVTAQLDWHVKPLPLLEVLARQCLVTGRSLQLLQGLKCMDKIPHKQGSLYEQFVSLVRTRVLPSLNSEDTQEHRDCGYQEDEEIADFSEPPTVLDEYMKDYLLGCNDAFMLKAFADIMDLGIDISHHESFRFPKDSLFFRSGKVCCTQNLGPVLNSSLSKLLVERTLGVGQQASELLHSKCRVGAHLAAVRGVALLESGVVMHQFFSYILSEIERQEDWHRWATWNVLTNQLQANISQHELEWSHLFSVSISGDRSPDISSEITEGFPLMQFINRLDLQYEREWPITLVLREENMLLYNKVFRFFAKLKCASLSLQKLRYQDINGLDGARRINVLRSWLLFLLTSLQEHMLGHILTTMRDQLESQLKDAKDLHTALAAHDEYVKKAHSYCLMDSKSLPAHNMILEVVALAMSVFYMWQNKSLDEEQINSYEQDYSKLHAFLNYLFANLTRLGANVHLQGVAAALCHSSPPY